MSCPQFNDRSSIFHFVLLNISASNMMKSGLACLFCFALVQRYYYYVCYPTAKRYQGQQAVSRSTSGGKERLVWRPEVHRTEHPGHVRLHPG